MDMATYTLTCFNLEAMKLSAYYKKKKEMVILTPSFTPERHQRFFVRKDYSDGIFPKKMTSYSNVDYGGLAFTDNIYHPLPMEIELCRPDTSIYSRMESAFINSKVSDRKKIFQNLMTAEHGRLSLDGSSIWDSYMRQFKYLPAARDLILHDYNLGAVEGSFEEVKKILSKARTDGWATKIGMKFPVQVSTGRDLINWSTLNPNRTFYSIQFNGLVDNESWFEYVTRCRQRSIYFNLDYWITRGTESQEFLVNEGMRRLLRQVILSRSQHIKFSLKYDDFYFFDRMWEKVIKLFQFYLTSLTSQKMAIYFKALPTDTVFDFAKAIMDKPYKTYGPEAMSKQEAREVFNFIRERNYPLFQDLYELSFNTLMEEKTYDWS